MPRVEAHRHHQPYRPYLFVAMILAVALAGIAAFHSGKLAPLARAITESRCRAGAFMYHSTTSSAVTADINNADALPAHAGTSATVKNVETIGPNLIPNAGLEQLPVQPPSAPAITQWTTNAFGDNDATFSLASGHNGKHAARVTMTTYTNGDADWYYRAVTVKPGQYYTFADYYRSNVPTRTVLALQQDANHYEYINLAAAAPSETWAQYRTVFFVPTGISQIIVYHPLAAVGYLETDDFQLAQARTTGFQEGLVSITFDDGWQSIHDNALPLMKQAGLVSTQYLISGYLGQSKAYDRIGDVYDFLHAGHEIASHTVDHPNLTDKTPAEVSYELKRSQEDLTKCFGSATSFAPPYGAYSDTTLAATAALYATSRSTDTGFNTADNLNPYHLVVQNVSAHTSATDIKDWLSTAKSNRAWLILVYHQIGTDSSGYARRTSDFVQDVRAIQASGLSVKTVSQAYAEVRHQVK